MATESRPCPSGRVRAQANTYDGARQMRKLPCNYSAQNHFQVFAGGGRGRRQAWKRIVICSSDHL